MINKRKNTKIKGFTLVELLAVIVILAIILVIAVPKVMSIIEDAKMGTLESTAKMIASQAEKQKVQNTVLGNDKAITCESITNINKDDYPSCEITFEDNTAKVTIVGGGKFAGLNVCEGTKTEATASKNACALSGVEVISALCTDDATCAANNLAIDVGGSIRYYGANPKNYIEFNNEVWRIIGVIEVKSSLESTIKEKRLKIVRNEALEDYQYATSESIKDDFYEYLNNNYYNILSPTAKGQIKISSESYSDNSFGYSIDDALNEYYNNSQNYEQEKIVSTINVIDYVLAANGNGLYSDSDGINNWLNKNTSYWTSSYCAVMEAGAYGQCYVYSSGKVDIYGMGDVSNDQAIDVYPVVFLKPDVKLTGTGENTLEGIYKIS